MSLKKPHDKLEDKEDNHDNDKKQDEMMTEEELKQMIEKIKKSRNDYQIVKSAFFYHPNLGMHMVVSLIMNIISSITVIGILNIFNNKMIIYSVGSYFLAITVFTLLSNVLSIIIAYFFLKKIWFVYGFVNYLIQILCFYLITWITNKNFDFNGIPALLIFTLSFTIMNYLLSLLYRKLIIKILDRLRRKGDNG